MEQEWYEQTKSGIKILRDPTYEEWYAWGEVLALDRTNLPWAIGKWVNLGQEKFGEKWSQATDLFGDYDYNTIANYASVERKVEPERRFMDKLSYSHHAAVAKFEPAEQTRWLKIALSDPDEDGRMLTAAELRAKIKGEDTKDPVLSDIRKIKNISANLQKSIPEVLIDTVNDINRMADELEFEYVALTEESLSREES